MAVAGAADAVGVGGGVFYEVREAMDGLWDEGVERGVGDGETPVVEGGAGVDLWLLVGGLRWGGAGGWRRGGGEGLDFFQIKVSWRSLDRLKKPSFGCQKRNTNSPP